jgi:hypothetical protein
MTPTDPDSPPSPVPSQWLLVPPSQPKQTKRQRLFKSTSVQISQQKKFNIAICVSTNTYMILIFLGC